MTKERLKSVIITLNRLRAKEQITDEEYVDILFPLVEPQTKIEYYPWYAQPNILENEPWPITYQKNSYRLYLCLQEGGRTMIEDV